MARRHADSRATPRPYRRAHPAKPGRKHGPACPFRWWAWGVIIAIIRQAVAALVKRIIDWLT